jgi:UDP:flavonoid glycosyltransferase YjiC (YdhE family)
VKRVLFAWELGAGAGHVTGFLPTALALREHGCDVLLAVRDLARTRIALGRHELPALQAPVWTRESPPLPPAMSYAELLLRFGYRDATDLAGMIRGWLALFDVVQPDLVVVDHGPTALLAARIAGLRRVTIGTGFYLPPRVHPLPSFRPWIDVPAGRLARSEADVLAVVNASLARVATAAPLRVLADLFDADEEFLCTVAELDHYTRAAGARYWGPTFDLSGGDEPSWPPGDGPRIFVYLPATSGLLAQLLTELAGMRAPVLGYVPGLGARAAGTHDRPSLRIGGRPLRMGRVLEQCDIVVCHGGHGTVAAALLAGRPLVVIPDLVERLLVARNAVRLGAAKMVNPDSRPKLRRLVEDVVSDEAFAQAARRFAARHADLAAAAVPRAIAARCRSLLETA